MIEAPRFSEFPFPPYRFRKRETPHPTQHPDGHFRGKEGLDCPTLDAPNWRDCKGYLFALDLFNHRYFWECHEVLEDLWHGIEPGLPPRHFLQAFIQCTVAHWHADAGRIDSAQALLRRIPPHVEAARGLVLGFDVADLHAATVRFIEEPGGKPLLLIPK